MDIKSDKRNSNYIQEQLSISIIKQIIINYINEKDTFKNEINDNPKIIEIFDYFIQNNVIAKYHIIKFNKFLTFINKFKNVIYKEYNESKEMILNNKIIFTISICFLRININKYNHHNIRKYLKALLIFYSNGKISINNLFYILEIILISIIETLKKKSIKQYQLFEINNEPLLLIKDIIETIINFPLVMLNNNVFIDNLINLFTKFFKKAEKINIILKSDELWLKLFENNSIKESSEFYNDNSYQNSIKKLINFLKEIYRCNIPKKLYDEIYKRSSIDFIYYINILEMLKELIKNGIYNQKNIKIDKGVYLFGNYYIKEHINFSSNEFSIILLFQLLHNNSEVRILNLVNKGKNIFLIMIKNDNLNIEINGDFKWNTNIKMNKKIYYFICITYNKTNKYLKLYINYDEISSKKLEEKMLRKENVNVPKFGKDMNAIIGDDNLYFILGDILFINKEFDIKTVRQLFNSKGYYTNLIMRNNENCDLIKYLTYSKDYNAIINNFKSLRYEYTLVNTYKLFLLKENNLNNTLFEFSNENCYNTFFNSLGIEFLTFMLHNIDSIILDNKLFNLYLSKTIEFISYILELLGNSINEYLIECDKEYLKNKLNMFFLTLFNILKSDKYYKILSDDIWYNLYIIFSLNLENSNIYKQIILSILLDYNLFEQRKFIKQLNIMLDKILINDINDELIYKIFLLDFIFESNNIKHKKFLNLINSICSSKNKYFGKALVKYILKLENEIKMYHYLKIIYINIKNMKEILSSDSCYLYEFIEKQLGLIDHFHCKYCSYIVILCYLIKQEILYDESDNTREFLLINNSRYMNNPSSLFLKAIFIENFHIPNNLKLKFIKSKNFYFNHEIFICLEFHPYELYNFEKFMIRFKSILKYIDSLMISKTNENINNFLKYFFTLIIDFSIKIKIHYSDNLFTQKIIDKIINDFHSSEEFTEFFILHIKYDERIALERIKSFIKFNFFNYFNPFYFRLLNIKYITKDENKTNEIKLVIMEYILNLMINHTKDKIEKKENINLFLILIHKIIYQNEIKKKYPRSFPDLFIKLYYLLDDICLLFNYNLVNLSFFDSKEEENINYKFVCEIILDIILKFYFRGNYDEQIVKSLLIKKGSNSTIFFEQDKKYLLGNIENKNNYNINKEEEEEKYFYKSEYISFCIYFLIYFFEVNLLYFEDDRNIITKNILEIIFNDLKNLYRNYIKKNSSIFKKIIIKSNNFDIYNEILDICNKHYKDDIFTFKFLQEKYNQINTKFKKEFKKGTETNIIEKEKEKNNVYDNINKSDLNNDLKKNDPNKDFNLYIKNELNYNIKEEKETSSINYLKEQLSKIDAINIYYKLIVSGDYSKENIKILFNPKEYYIWNKFSFFLKDYIFYNKKFIKIYKTFKIHLNQTNNNDDNNYYLNYPTKIKNFTADEYYRPFLKPCLNFLYSKYLKKTHPYVKEELIKKLEYKNENINLIKYKRIIPKLNDKKYFCELFKNKGNIFGYIELNDNFLIFQNSPNDDLSSSEDPEKCLPFLFSIKEDRIIDKDKYVLIFYEDIKEILKRRVCLLYIGLEIFLKNNRTYMFNFFDKNNINKFIIEIKKFTQSKNTLAQNPKAIKKEHEKKINNDINSLNNNNNNLSLKINNVNKNDSIINFKIIEAPVSEFKKLQLQEKNKKGELSNFNYLLLINKYSSRTYNDFNQYLVFPQLFTDIENKIKRDLSKVISLNKENNTEDYNKAKFNYSLFKYHFNQHYSTSGFILYYLVRLIPYTYQHLIFQSMEFDAPTRLFSSLNHIYNFLKITDDNRELIPEFYFSFDFLLNLNHNDFGIYKNKEETYHINNVDIYCKYYYPEFIIKSRNYLEQSDLSPWIDIIFGAKQTLYSEEQPNLFNLKTYEEFSQLENIKEKEMPLKQKIKEIKENVDVFKIGTSPAKVFNKLHEKMNIKNYDKENDYNISDENNENSLNIINKYIQKKVKEKFDYYFINTKNNTEFELIFMFKNKIDIFKLKLRETKYAEISQKIQEIVNLEPYENLLCEIFPEIYCIVRFINNTISFISQKKIIIYNFNCLVTSVENKINKNFEEKSHKEIFIGDEKGILHLMEIIFDFNKNKIYEIKNIMVKKSVKVQEGRINGLLYNERLNIIISWSDENDNYISINNDYDLNFINIIKIKEDICIKEILVSKYDLIYISCYKRNTKFYKIYSYTLNGLKVSIYDNFPVKIVKCFVDEKINIIFRNRNALSFYLYTFEEIINNFYCDFTNDFEDLNINSCQYYPQNKQYLMICSNNKAYFFDNDNNFI